MNTSGMLFYKYYNLSKKIKKEMEESSPTKFCMKCMNNIRLSSFLIHQLKCKGNVSNSRQSSQASMRQSMPSSSRRFRPSRSSSHSSNLGMEVQQRIPCTFCGYQQTFAELDTHPNECLHRDEQCSDCHVAYPRSLMDDHKMTCPESHIRRPYHERFRRPNHYQPQQEPELEEQHSFARNRGRRFQQPVLNRFDQMMMNQGRQVVNPYAFMNGFHQVERNDNRMMIRLGGGDPIMIRNGESGSIGVESFMALIEMMAHRGNQNRHPGLRSEEIEKLEKIKYHQQNEGETDLCTICYCDFEENQEINKLICGHLYHHECIGKWLETNAQCPVCKKSQLPNRRQPEAEEEEEYSFHH